MTEFQFLIGIINPPFGGSTVIAPSGFQFLIGIINPDALDVSMDELWFQFLIGIINPSRP